MRRTQLLFLPILVVFLVSNIDAEIDDSYTIQNLYGLTDFRNLLENENNLLVLFINNIEQTQRVINIFHRASSEIKQNASLVIVDCKNRLEAQICSRYKISPNKSYIIRYYGDFSFHKDFDWRVTTKSILSFLNDPTGPMPWEFDINAGNVIHLDKPRVLEELLNSTNGSLLVMYYGTWCAHCEDIQPAYAAAATELKGRAVFAAIDVTKKQNIDVKEIHNITFLPTVLYYLNGRLRFPYEGIHDKRSIMDFMARPKRIHFKKMEYADSSDVLTLKADILPTVVKLAEQVLVSYYVPWCGHCKRLKPEFETAATILKNRGVNVILGAIDATVNTSVLEQTGIKSYPILKYYYFGTFQYDAGNMRNYEDIINFIENPVEPPLASISAKPWPEELTSVYHLTSRTFESILAPIQHVLVMFYAPWCSYSKLAKPEFVRASDYFSADDRVAFAAVDCTVETDLCRTYKVPGFPTIKYFHYYNRIVSNYTEHRKMDGFVFYINKKLGMQKDWMFFTTTQRFRFGPHVNVLADNTFENTINKDQPTFVMFFATWCEHCGTSVQPYSTLAKKVQDEKYDLSMAAIDAAENPRAADIAEIKIIPTFKLFSKGKVIATYKGGRSADDLYKFIKAKMMKIKDEL